MLGPYREVDWFYELKKIVSHSGSDLVCGFDSAKIRTLVFPWLAAKRGRIIIYPTESLRLELHVDKTPVWEEALDGACFPWAQTFL